MLLRVRRLLTSRHYTSVNTDGAVMPHPQPVRDITWDDLKHLRVDRTGRLLWNGSPVATEQRVRLTRGQTVAVVAGLGLLFVHTLVTVVQVGAAVFPHAIAALVPTLG
jgi:hypothetical protein